MAQIIDGKKISQDIKDELKEKVTALKDTGTEVALAVIQRSRSGSRIPVQSGRSHRS